jgi:CRP-like cAMP-binding protein
MEAYLYNFLKEFPILTEAERQLIVDNSNIQAFDKGSYLLREGQIARHCYLVLKGCVREFIIQGGEEKTIAFYTEHQPIALFTSATQGSKARHYLVCIEDCILTVSNQAMEEEMCRLIPRLESIIRHEVEKNSGILQDKLSRFITLSPEERYLDLLAQRPDLFRRVPLNQIASLLGITPESLSRIRKRTMQKQSQGGQSPKGIS